VPATSSGASIAVPFVAADDHLGPLTVELWVRHRASDGDPPPPFSKVVQSSSSPLTYTFPHGDGAYEFATVAVGPSLDVKPRGGNGDSWLLLYSHTSPVGTPPEQLDPYRERGIGDRSLIGSGRVSE
jgi:hypothetical protein